MECAGGCREEELAAGRIPVTRQESDRGKSPAHLGRHPGAKRGQIVAGDRGGEAFWFALPAPRRSRQRPRHATSRSSLTGGFESSGQRSSSPWTRPLAARESPLSPLEAVLARCAWLSEECSRRQDAPRQSPPIGTPRLLPTEDPGRYLPPPVLHRRRRPRHSRSLQQPTRRPRRNRRRVAGPGQVMGMTPDRGRDVKVHQPGDRWTPHDYIRYLLPSDRRIRSPWGCRETRQPQSRLSERRFVKAPVLDARMQGPAGRLGAERGLRQVRQGELCGVGRSPLLSSQPGGRHRPERGSPLEGCKRRC
jgi:hypothetical protein